MRAVEIALSYLLGKPTQAVELQADIRGAAQIDVRALAARLPPALVTTVVAELDSDDPPLLPPAGDGEGDGDGDDG